MTENNIKIGFIKTKSFKIALAAILIVFSGIIVLGFGKYKTNNESTSQFAVFSAKRGPLTISLTESGTIKPRDQIILKNEVEGRTSIITLIPEGTRVKKGDLLVELDVSELLDSKIDQEIRVQNAEASYISANENLAVVENQAKSDIDKATLTLEFARQDLKKYLEGEYPNYLKEADAKITLAQEELTRAQETLKWSRTLYAEKYISQTELQADELAEKKKALDLELARNNRNLLIDFTYQRNLAQLESDVSQADMALERTTRKAKANVVQAQADLKAKESEYQRQKDKLQKIVEQVAKAKIYAPVDGLVIYATSAQRGGFRGSEQPLDEGQEVRERQELIYLPTAESAKAEVNIHESNLEKVRLGLPTIITVDALPGKKFYGSVTRIAPLPDAQSMWMNPDLKVYNTDIYLDGSDSGLRTGMSCQAEIIIERYDDVIYVPVQAVLRVRGATTVYVLKGQDFEPREVEIGLDNNRMIRIINGLKEGEVVSLTPPLQSAAVEHSTDVVGTEKIPSEEKITEDKAVIPEDEAMKPEGEAVKPASLPQPQPEIPPAENRDINRERSKNMTPEEKQKMRERFMNMPEAERKKMARPRRRIDPNQVQNQ